MSSKSTTNSTTNPKAAKSAGWFLNLLSFVAVICIGVSLILSELDFLSKIQSALRDIAQIVSYIVIICVSCFYIIKRRNIWLWVTWGISVALIVIYFIIR